MACPFFQPTTVLEHHQAWAVPPRLPLGEACAGMCRAAADTFEPDASLLHDLCNRGYGRHACPRFPHNATADAIRFSLESDSGGVLTIVFVYELNHAPERYGRIEYRESTAEFNGPLDDPIALAQARIFIASYLRRKVPA